MADFAPELRNQEPDQYLKLSQGWRDSSVGTLIGGLSDMLKLTVSAVDERNKTNITEEATAAVDETRDRSIAELHDITRNPPPKEISMDMRRLQAHKLAAEAGSARESNYWGALDSTARKLRARYPGYREHIDQEMKRLTGQDPANALVRELRQDWEAMNRKSGDDPEKRRLNLLESYTKEFGGLPPGWQTMSYDKVMEMYSDESRKKYALQQRQSMLKTATDQRTFDRTEAGDVASSDWGSVLQKEIRGTGTVYANNLKTMQEIERAVQSRGGFAPTAEETQRYTAAAGAAADSLSKQFVTWANTPRDFLGGKTYAAVIGRDKLAEIKANQLDQIVGDIQSSITNKDFGFAKRATLMASIYSDSEKYRLLGNSTLRRIGAMREIIGEAGTSVLMQGSVLNEVQQALKLDAVTAMADPNDPVSLTKAMEKIGDKGEAKPALAREVINGAVDTLTNDGVPLAAKKQLIDSLYGPGNETFLSLVNKNPRIGGTPEAPQRVFQMMANSRMAKTVWELSQSSGDPSLWTRYERWVTSQVFALNTLDINTVARAQRDAPNVDIRWDPMSMSFRVDDVSGTPGRFAVDSGSVGMTVLRAGANAYENSRSSGIRAAVDKLNASLVPLRDVAELRKVDRTAYTLSVLNNLGLRAESLDGRESVAQSLLTRLNKVLYDNLEPRLREGLKRNISTTRTPSESDTREPIDITPPFPDVSQGPAARALRWLGNTFGTLPSREQMDRDRSGDLVGRRRTD